MGSVSRFVLLHSKIIHHIAEFFVGATFCSGLCAGFKVGADASAGIAKISIQV